VTKNGNDSLTMVARAAVQLYFNPITALLAWRERRSSETLETQPSYASRVHIRRVEDRQTYNFAVAFGLVAVMASVAAGTSMFRLSQAENALQARAVNYFIDIHSQLPSTRRDVGVTRLSGSVYAPRHSLASAIANRYIPQKLSISRLDLIPVVRTNPVDGQWIAQDSLDVSPDGSFILEIAPTVGCRKDCQVAVLLVPEGSVRPGYRSYAIPAASAASRIISMHIEKDASSH
jgi:hypothetical protein